MADGTSPRSVCALVGRSSEPLARALASQRHAPDAAMSDPGPLDAGLRRALESGAEWIWVLDGSVAPKPDALIELLEALDRVEGLPAPAVLSSVVLGPDGRVDRDRAAWYRRGQVEVAMAAAQRRLLPISAAPGPFLVHRGAAEGTPPTRRALATPGAVLECTARMLRDRVGYLVPESKGVSLARARDPGRDSLAAVRLIAGGALTAADRVRFGFDLAERAATSVGRRARGGPRPTRG